MYLSSMSYNVLTLKKKNIFYKLKTICINMSLKKRILKIMYNITSLILLLIV